MTQVSINRSLKDYIKTVHNNRFKSLRFACARHTEGGYGIFGLVDEADLHLDKGWRAEDKVSTTTIGELGMQGMGLLGIVHADTTRNRNLAPRIEQDVFLMPLAESNMQCVRDLISLINEYEEYTNLSVPVFLRGDLENPKEIMRLFV